MSSADQPASLPAEQTSVGVSYRSRFYAAFWGMFIGDALCMATHGYSSPEHIERDYGWPGEYRTPGPPHPDSPLYRTHYAPINERNAIMHTREQSWRVPGAHPHSGLSAGDNTVNLQLVRVLLQSIEACGCYDQEDYLRRYLEFFLQPDGNPDHYIPHAHREFFKNYARGKELQRCGMQGTHLDGIVLCLPLMLMHARNLTTMKKVAREHLALTHQGEAVARGVEFACDALHQMLQGHEVETALFEKVGRDRYTFLTMPYRRWRDQSDDRYIAAHELGRGPLCEDAIPLTLYLAIKYAADPELALATNASLGGDNAHRGAILGALLGAANGCEAIPGDWVEGLTACAELDRLSDVLWELSSR
ncbi:MAG: ADP-ribosylglycohydrolase family protein [Opitutales bacterium]